VNKQTSEVGSENICLMNNVEKPVLHQHSAYLTFTLKLSMSFQIYPNAWCQLSCS